MKPLFFILWTLSVLWIGNAAPQPLFNTTVGEMRDLTTASVSELVSTDSPQTTQLSTTSEVPASSTSSERDRLEITTEIAELREDTEEIISDVDVRQGTTLVVESDSTESKNISERKDTTDTHTSTGTTSTKPVESVEIVSESEIPITRYVPPLDPMKHMLMMADIKGMPNLSNLMPKRNFKPTISTTEDTISKDSEPVIEIVSSESSDVIEKIDSESSDIEENHEEIEDDVDSSSESIIDRSTEKIFEETTEKTDSLEKIVEVSTEKLVNESSEKANEDSTESDEDLEEKVMAESSEVEENHEKFLAKTTISDDTPISTGLVMTTNELNTITELNSETSSEYSSTENITPSTNKEKVLDITVKPDVSETAAFHKNSETIIKSDETTAEKEEKHMIVNVTTAKVFTSTEEAIKVDVTTTSDGLLKNEAIESETTLLESETTSQSPSSTESDFELKTTETQLNKDITSTTSTQENKDITSTASTTILPETTSDSVRVTPPKEVKNISLDDELEFRAVKIPLNVSKVSYVEREPVAAPIATTTEDGLETGTETESTTESIFTTIANILFSSSTTESADRVEESNEDMLTSTINLEPLSTELTLPVEKLEFEAESDSGTVLSNDPADMLKVQSVTAELGSIPAKETSTVISSTESLVTETPHVELLSNEFKTTNESELTNNENIEEEKFDESTVRADTVTVPLSTAEDVTTKSYPAITTPVVIAETEMENTEHKNVLTLESETETPNESTSEENPSGYLLNIKNRYVSGDNRDMVAAVQFLHYHDKASSEQCFKLVDAHWNYATNLTEENKKKQLEQTLEYSLFHKAAWKNATSFAWKSFNDTLLRRWFKSLSVLGTAALPEDKLNEFNRLKAEMKNKYSTAKICTYVPLESARRGQILREKDCNLTLEPDLQRILTKSRDYDELVHVWKSWRDAAGKPIRDKYLRFVELSNEAARMNGFSDTGDMWRESYESETFESDLEEIWEQLRPLYEHLHAYVRRKLIQQYGSDKIKEDGPIPAHLFGNMWAQSWVSLLDITQPFPGKPSVDVTPIMEAKNMTAFEMFKIAEEFFISLGLKAMPKPFWDHSLIEKPKDREIICHASAWDFCNGKDYRIKQCTDITMEDLITVHHEMGHVQYFLQYARQPNVFREGANPGFHEAIGDVLALSVSTPKHLKSIELLDEVADDPEGDLNFLLYTALDKVSFLPSGYLIDLWRWGLFSGDIKPEEMNSKWWELRLKYQGVCPPVKRTDTDFDPGAKFHVPGNVPYIRYFVSFVIQFQFHKVLCDAAGHTGPLYKCDIYRSKEAGQILSQVMELGSSEHWSEVMKIMTGGTTSKMDAGPILEYFEPLLDFLKEQNLNETLGWRSNDATICP